jgi:hypothetical protein
MKETTNHNIQQTSLSDILAASKKPKGKAPRHKKGEKFLKGPVPWDWIVKAANLSGSALKVTYAVWFLSGMKNTDTIKLSNSILKELGVSRRSKYRALKTMEEVGLISVSNKTGSSPDITINRCPIT